MNAVKNTIHAFKETGEVMGGWTVEAFLRLFGKPENNAETLNHANSAQNAAQREQNRTLGLGEAGYQQQVINNTCSAQFRNHNGGY